MTDANLDSSDFFYLKKLKDTKDKSIVFELPVER